MAENHPATIPAWRLDALRTELTDLAYELERQHRPDAADVAIFLGVRLGEILAEATSNPVPTGTASLLSS